MVPLFHEKNEALKQNPALAPFSVLIGQWTVEATHPYVPDTILHGQHTFTWIAEGAFVMQQQHIDDGRFPDGIAIFGSDDVAKHIT